MLQVLSRSIESEIECVMTISRNAGYRQLCPKKPNGSIVQAVLVCLLLAGTKQGSVRASIANHAQISPQLDDGEDIGQTPSSVDSVGAEMTTIPS